MSERERDRVSEREREMQEITKGKWCKRVASASRIFFFFEKGRGIGMEYLESGRERVGGGVSPGYDYQIFPIHCQHRVVYLSRGN